MRQIGGLLGRSPFGPLYEQMVKVAGAVDELPRIIAAVARGDDGEVARLAERVRTVEREADEIKSNIRDRLSRSLFTLADRAETLHLVSSIDAIADDALAVAKLLSVRKTPVRGKLEAGLVSLAERSREAVATLVGILGLLRDVMEGGAGEGKGDANEVLDRIESLSEVDSAVEDGEAEFLQTLFAQEDDLGPVGVVVLMQVVRQVADIARRAENVADGIRRTVLHR